MRVALGFCYPQGGVGVANHIWGYGRARTARTGWAGVGLAGQAELPGDALVGRPTDGHVRVENPYPGGQFFGLPNSKKSCSHMVFALSRPNLEGRSADFSMQNLAGQSGAAQASSPIWPAKFCRRAWANFAAQLPGRPSPLYRPRRLPATCIAFSPAKM